MDGERVEDLRIKLADLSTNLRRWDRRTFGSVRRETKELKQKLEQMRNQHGRTGPSHEQNNVHQRIQDQNHRQH